MKLVVKPNVVKAHFNSYLHYWRGTPKVGKTTMFRDVMIEEFGDAKFGLLLSLGNEKGHEAISGIYAQHVPDWTSFRSTVLELIKNKDEYGFKVIGLDTVDELVSMAEVEVIDEDWRKKNGRGKRSTLNSALGGYGAGHKRKKKLIVESIRALRNAGYGLVFIGHTKEKLMTEKGSDEQYYRLVSNLGHSDDEIFANISDVIATFHVVRSSDGEKRVKNTMRYIFFRDNNFVSAGSHFSGMPEKVPFGENGALAYLNALRLGVKNSSIEGITEEEIDKRAKAEEESLKKSGDKYAKKVTKSLEKIVLETLVSKAVALAKSCGGSEDESVMKILKKYEENGRIDKVKDEEKLKEAISELEEFKENK